ncbi:GGDEF domain-containing protein [Actinocrispum sp. NPDC049592]|uniref:GGDEF domain-containing protein n=1 Tax=Actinocrispum sp. NPDC049592 TaxID=3154835 RepID=UPI003436FD3A
MFGSQDRQPTAARIGGLLLVIGGGLALLLCAAVPGFVHGNTTPTAFAAGAAVVIGLFSVLNAQRIPHWFVCAIGPLGIALIAMSSLLTRTSADGSELLYLWPVLFTAYFLSWRNALFNVVLIAVIYTPTAIWIRGMSGITPSVYMIGTSVVALAVTASLRRQVNRAVSLAAREARTDKLTDLPNRRSWDDGLAATVARQIERGAPMCLLMIDLDLFKQLNDTHGHAAGDTALAFVASVLREQTRQTDLLARIGGEEFAVALPDCALADGVRRAEKIRQAVETNSTRLPATLTVSIGVAALHVDATTTSELMARADAALYAAKRSGRNAVRAVSLDAAS